MRFLVVEDDDKLARALARGLRHEGYAVDLAADADSALLHAAVYEYDAVVLDVMLPGRDGFDVCRMLRERGCGWQVDPTVEGIVRGLRAATSIDSATLEAMGARGRTLVAAEFGWQRIARSFLLMYDDCLVHPRD